MTLFPQLDTAYYSDDDRTVHQMLEYYYAQTITVQQSFWSEADLDTRFKIGDQSLWNDVYGNLPAFRKRQFNFNRIRRIINMITGYQRQHRLSTVVTAVNDEGNATASQMTKALMWVNKNSSVLETISDAFEGAITTGMNLLSVWMDYRQDPISGDIRVDNCSYNEYLIDPFFKKSDLSDCRFIWTRKWLNKRELKSLFPGREYEIDSMYARGWRDGKFQFQPEAYNYAMQDLLTYDEFYYMDYRSRKLVVDTTTGGTREWHGSDDNLKEYLSAFRQLTTVDQIIPTVKLAIQINGRTFYHGPQPSGIDRYMFVPVLCYYEPDSPYFPNRCQGVIRGLRDSQYLYNRRKIIELDILESQINSGVKYKEDSLVNPKDAFLAGQGRVFALKKDAEMTDVEFIQAPQIPPSMIQLSEILGREIQEISGVSDELLGMAEDDKPGVLSMLRQGAALTTLQKPFDQLNYAQTLLGSLQIELMQKNFTPGKLKRITGEEPTDEFYSIDFAKYNIVVEEGLYTATQKQMQFKQLLDLKSLGVEVPSKTLLEASTLQNKEKLIADITAQEQQMAQQQQQQAQYEQKVQQATIQSLQAKAMADQGLGLERVARIEENKALAEERMAQADNERSMAVYHELQAIKELENIDIDQIHKLVSVIEAMKNMHQNQENIAKVGVNQ